MFCNLAHALDGGMSAELIDVRKLNVGRAVMVGNRFDGFFDLRFDIGIDDENDIAIG